MSFTLAELAAQVGGEVSGDGTLRLDAVAPLEDAGPKDLSFFSNRKYRKAFEATRAGAVVVEPDERVPEGRTVLRARNAYLAFAKISTLFHPPREALPEVSPAAVIHPSASVHPSAQVMPLACVGPNARVGARTILFPGAHVCDDAKVGEDCLVYHDVVVRERCVVGDRVILQPGCVIGSDGFGFAFDPDGEGQGPRHFKVPQVGNVVVEDDVEIGANTTVDRATLGETRIGRGTKIDNLVQVAHSVVIGEGVLVLALAGFSGSVTVGPGAIVAGQVGVRDHITIGAGARVVGQAGVTKDVDPGATVSGYPAQNHRDALRLDAAIRRVPDLLARVDALEARIAELSARRSSRGRRP